jgi:cob(I)alamin adenosyltransferase
MCEKTIEELTATLTESQEQLESAKRDIDFHQHEKKRLMSASTFQGESYISAGQQVRAMQNERAELLKDLDAARGQTGLANESVDRVQALLDTERQANALLRKRQELDYLHNKLKAAHHNNDLEKQKVTELEHEICSLQDTIVTLKDDIVCAQADAQAAVQVSQIERQTQDLLRDEIKTLEDKYRAEVLASVQATAERIATQQRPGSQTPQNDLDSSAGKDYFRPPTGRAQSGDDHGITTASPVASPGQFNGLAKSPRSQAASPDPQAKSPGSESGFRTIHGRHRPDGSLGGYRVDRVAQRKHSENLYESSILHERSEERSLRTQTSHSDAPSVTNSEEARSG